MSITVTYPATGQTRTIHESAVDRFTDLGWEITDEDATGPDASASPPEDDTPNMED